MEEKPEERNWAEEFQEQCHEDNLCLSFKKNFSEPDAKEEMNSTCSAIMSYLFDSNVEVLASTAGLHLNGENKVPHVHVHVLVIKSTVPKTMLSQASTHRQRKGGERMRDVSMKSQVPRDALCSFLAYPFKEGLILSSRFQLWMKDTMPRDCINFLKELATSIYQSNLAKNLIRDKSEQRKEKAYLELLEIARTGTYSSYKEFLIYMENEYIEKLQPEDMCDIRNYKRNLEKIAVALRIIKTYEL